MFEHLVLRKKKQETQLNTSFTKKKISIYARACVYKDFAHNGLLGL